MNPIIYGGEGVQIGNSSIPIDQITSVVFFKNEQAMWTAARQVRSETINQGNYNGLHCRISARHTQHLRQC